ncbi:muts domain V-domain-containing protein [Scheffersomyces coipomensis]|uniref:muts domain V-domain-containing protein n=1 Tax=Scheffersomyces coipomensis TaxID=1788519 RepID=UPI00315D1221
MIVSKSIASILLTSSRRSHVIVRALGSTSYLLASKSKRLESEAATSQKPILGLTPSLDWDRGGRKEKESLSPLYALAKKLVESHPNCVSLIQVGSFYELYFEQAEEFGPKLGLRVATRKTTNFAIPMAGFPVSQLQKFVKILVQDLSENVAIVDQYPERETTADIIHRKVSRIITPGTLVDETFLNYGQNNYLASIYLPPNCTDHRADPDIPVGISWIDLSVGDFYVQQTTLGEIDSDISRINPSEIILPKDFQDKNLINGKWYAPFQQLRKYFIRYHKTMSNDLKSKFKSRHQVTKKTMEGFSTGEIAAMNMVLSYIQVNLPDSNPQLDVPLQYWNSKYMQLDPRTREALELTERSTGGRSSTVGSLFTTIKRTVTQSGSRLLTQYLRSPTLDIKEIVRRQSYVSMFVENSILKTSLRAHLTQLGDFVRSLQRLSFGAGDSVQHLLSIGEGLQKLENLETFLIEEYKNNRKSLKALGDFLQQFQVPIDISREISSTLHVESIPIMEPKEEITSEIEVEDETYSDSGSYSNASLEKYRHQSPVEAKTFDFSVKRDFNEVLSGLHDELESLLTEQDVMFDTLRKTLTEIDPKLVVSKKDQHGRFVNVIHIKGNEKSVEEVSRIYKSDIREKRKGIVLFKPMNWSKLQNSIESVKEEIRLVEKEIVENLRANVLERISSIRKVSKLVDFLDVTISYSILAEEYKLVCPKFVKTNTLNISEGRHLVVEAALKEVGVNFTPNDTKVSPSESMWIISGPNMGGKSTFLRQNALIVILAQIGCFVPASKASIGLVDKIFTRIGASDDLYNDLSTFMVEMVETSNILKNATPRSLAIVDEIGRGTSGKEGLALAYATLINLLTVNKCRTLFATHFGIELKKLLEENKIDQNKIEFLRTRVLSNDIDTLTTDLANIIIDHTLEPGISERSFALEVAAMAGFPEAALKNAATAYKCLVVN